VCVFACRNLFPVVVVGNGDGREALF
jgi:hypothetical protein